MTDESSIGPVLHPFIGIPGLPFSEMVEAGRLMFLSGQIGSGADGKLVAGGIRAETRQTLANIAAVLKRHGLSMDRIVKVTVMMADMAEWSAMNEEYIAAFGTHLPARSAFGTSGLAMNARVEIEHRAEVRLSNVAPSARSIRPLHRDYRRL